MKIKFPTYEIELSIEELKELLVGINQQASISSSNKPKIINKTGSGNYPHKSKISQEKIDLIKKIFENYPDRSVRTVAKELGLHNSTISRWKNKLFPKVS